MEAENVIPRVIERVASEHIDIPNGCALPRTSRTCYQLGTVVRAMGGSKGKQCSPIQEYIGEKELERQVIR
jgi:hypothetical protein